MDGTPFLLLTKEIEEPELVLFDPINRNLKSIEISELCSPGECVSSSYGWLLLQKTTSLFFFFNPFTRPKVEVPNHIGPFDVTGCSAPPTSSDCIVFTVTKQCERIPVNIRMWRVGESTWTYCTGYSSNFNSIEQAVYCSGVLYCMDSLGRIGAFNVGERSWSVVCTTKCAMIRNSYLVEWQGEVLAGVRDSLGVLIRLYKLELGTKVGWVKEKDLEGVSLFLGPYGSCSSATMEGLEVVVAGSRPDLKCVVYNWNGCYYGEDIMSECPPFGSQYTPIWIQQPSD